MTNVRSNDRFPSSPFRPVGGPAARPRASVDCCFLNTASTLRLAARTSCRMVSTCSHCSYRLPSASLTRRIFLVFSRTSLRTSPTITPPISPGPAVAAIAST